MPRIELKPGVFWVGARDWTRRVFDALIPLPLGTSYNAYLVKGKDKTALIDTVNPGFEPILLDNIRQVHDGGIDYIIMNHAEPDHAGGIPVVMETWPDAKVVASKKGLEMASFYYKVGDEKAIEAGEGDTIDLGGKTLRFIDAPFLHWPETIFTYIEEDKVLFPCDFFGFHSSQAFYDDEEGDMIPMAQAYFGEIMMPFAKMGRKAMDKLESYDIDMICPSHGPIHKDPKPIMEAYDKWTAGETKEKVMIAYVSMWKSTEMMVTAMQDVLMTEGIDVHVHNLDNADLGHLARDLVDSRAVILGSPTVLGGIHPVAAFAAALVKALRPPARYGAFLGSYGWSGGAQKQALEILGSTKIELVDAIDVKGPPSGPDLDKVKQTAKTIADKVKAG